MVAKFRAVIELVDALLHAAESLYGPATSASCINVERVHMQHNGCKL